MQANMRTLKASAPEDRATPITANATLEVPPPRFSAGVAEQPLFIKGTVHQIFGYTLVAYELTSNQSKWVLALFVISGIVFSPLLYIVIIGPWQVSEGQFHNGGTNSSERLFGRSRSFKGDGMGGATQGYTRRKSMANPHRKGFDGAVKEIAPCHTPPLVKEGLAGKPLTPRSAMAGSPSRSDPQSDTRSGEQIPSPRMLPNVVTLPPKQEAEPEAFCPDLIVPSDNVCQLVIPIREWMTNETPIDIKGQDGSSVVQVFVRDTSKQSGLRSPRTASSVGPGRTQVVLQTPTGDRLAHCQMTSPEEFHFHNRLGEYYATLSPGEKRSFYQLVMPGGRTLIYRGDFEEFDMEITDTLGETLARTEKCIAAFDTEGRESYYGTILAPGTDVGLLVCGMLCAQILSMTAPKAASSASESSSASS